MERNKDSEAGEGHVADTESKMHRFQSLERGYRSRCTQLRRHCCRGRGVLRRVGGGGQTSDKWAWSKQGGWEAGREAPEREGRTWPSS